MNPTYLWCPPLQVHWVWSQGPCGSLACNSLCSFCRASPLHRSSALVVTKLMVNPSLSYQRWISSGGRFWIWGICPTINYAPGFCRTHISTSLVNKFTSYKTSVHRVTFHSVWEHSTLDISFRLSWMSVAWTRWRPKPRQSNHCQIKRLPFFVWPTNHACSCKFRDLGTSNNSGRIMWRLTLTVINLSWSLFTFFKLSVYFLRNCLFEPLFESFYAICLLFYVPRSIKKISVLWSKLQRHYLASLSGTRDRIPIVSVYIPKQFACHVIM